MILTISIGSSGEGVDRYSINFPIVISPGKKINIENVHSVSMADGLKVTIEKHHYLYSLKVESFDTKQEAYSYIDKFLASLKWVSLKHKVGIKLPVAIHEPRMNDLPIKVSEKSNIYEDVRDSGWSYVDGDYDIDKLTIIPENKKLMRWNSGQVSVVLGLNPDTFVKDLEEGVSFVGIDNILREKKLCLAIELYSAYQFEMSRRAKFVKLVTVIESLLPVLNISEQMLQILGEVKKIIKKELKMAKTKDDSEAIELLLSRLGELKRQSISFTIKAYMSDCIREFPVLGDERIILPKLKDLYGIRSSLLHRGECEESDLQQGIELLSELVPKLLTELFIKHSSKVS